MLRYRIKNEKGLPDEKSYGSILLSKKDWVYSKNSIPELESFLSEIDKEEAHTMEAFIHRDAGVRRRTIDAVNQRVAVRTPVAPEPSETILEGPVENQTMELKPDPSLMTREEITEYMLVNYNFLKLELEGKDIAALHEMLSLVEEK